MAKNRNKSKSRRRILLLGFMSIIVIFITKLSIGKYWIEIFEKYKEKKDLENELIALKEKEEELKVDANKLQNPEYVARYAREKYMYSKEGEYILQIPEE